VAVSEGVGAHRRAPTKFPPVHLYLHVPFCARRCSYCDFAIAVRKQVPSRAYGDAVLREWDGWQDHPAWTSGGEIETIYFGGGTPSLLDPAELERILDSIRRRPTVEGVEITMEANPDDVTPEHARRWRGMGCNRVSLGVQSFDPAVLTWMHRTHTADDVPRAVATLREAGFANISLDLIFALPPELGRDWSRDLAQAFELNPEHLSLYGLTVEERTPIARWMARGETSRSDDETYAREFLAADVALRAHGFEHYEVSNAARPGYRSLHNSAYWRRRPFIGLGPSAHSGFGNQRQWNVREWSAYQAAMNDGDSAVDGREQLDAEALALEDLYLGLRTREGVVATTIPASVLNSWVVEGWAINDGERTCLTPEGWLRLDALAALDLTHVRTTH
jgi:oxygen-independent coproporphyrinogen-3 oxidase